MPVSAQVERLKRQLAGRLDDCEVLAVDLYSLTGSERDAALDAIVTGQPSPFVLIEGRLVCTGGVELDAVLAALEATIN